MPVPEQVRSLLFPITAILLLAGIIGFAIHSSNKVEPKPVVPEPQSAFVDITPEIAGLEISSWKGKIRVTHLVAGESEPDSESNPLKGTGFRFGFDQRKALPDLEISINSAETGPEDNIPGLLFGNLEALTKLDPGVLTGETLSASVVSIRGYAFGTLDFKAGKVRWKDENQIVFSKLENVRINRDKMTNINSLSIVYEVGTGSVLLVNTTEYRVDQAGRVVGKVDEVQRYAPTKSVDENH